MEIETTNQIVSNHLKSENVDREILFLEEILNDYETIFDNVIRNGNFEKSSLVIKIKKRIKLLLVTKCEQDEKTKIYKL